MNDDQDEGNDDGKSKWCAGLREIMWCQAFYWDKRCEGVVVQSANEAEAEVQNGFLDLCGKVAQQGHGAVSVKNERDECRGEESFQEFADGFVKVGCVGWIRHQSDVEEHNDEGAEEEYSWRSREDR